MNQQLQQSKAETKRFLDFIAPDEKFTFQTFDDDQDRKRPHLTKIFHGHLDDLYDTLVHYNKQGAGIFVVINKTDLMGRKKGNILKVRACFADLDGAPVEPVLKHPTEPAMVVESSEGRYHAYYPCPDMPLEAFDGMQRAIAEAFNGDPAVCDLPRVMRVPGFFHQKKKNGICSEPFMTQIESYCSNVSYTYAELKEAFPPSKTSSTIETEKDFFGDESVDPNKIRGALEWIDPGLREDWIKVGHALKRTDPSLLALYLEWSRGDLSGRKPHNYVNDADVILTWNGFEPERIGIASIFAMAKANGYVETSRKAALRVGSQVEVATTLHHQVEAETASPLIYSEGRFWSYNSAYWAEFPESKLRQRIHKLDGTPFGKKSILRISRSFIDGVIREMAAMADNPDFFEAPEQGVNLSNGFVRILTSGKISLEPHSPEHRQRFLLSQAWRPNLCELPDGFLQTLLFGSFGKDGIESHRLILEIIGSAITGINTSLSNPKAFVFHGPSAANGKSTIQAVMRSLLPRHIVACIAPADLGQPQFLATLAGCQVNLSDEISSSKAIATDRFKATVTGDAVQAKAIYREPFTFTPKALHVFSANHLPSFSGGVDNGIVRRIVVIPFNRSIPEAERIPDLAVKIVEREGDILVSLALQAAADVIARGGYTVPPNCTAATEQWFKDADPVAEWFEDGGLARHVKTAGILVRELYLRFREDMNDLGVHHIPGRSRFTQRLRERIESDPGWDIVRRNQGQMVFPRTLVTKVSSFPS